MYNVKSKEARPFIGRNHAAVRFPLRYRKSGHTRFGRASLLNFFIHDIPEIIDNHLINLVIEYGDTHILSEFP